MTDPQIEIIGEAEPYDFVNGILPDLVRPITPLIALNISLIGITRLSLSRLVDSLHHLEDLVVYDSLGALPESYNASEGFGVQWEDPVPWRLSERSIMTTNNLTELFLPLSRLHCLRRFTFSTVVNLEQCDICLIFHWRDALPHLHTLTLQDEALTREVSNRGWRSKLLPRSC